MNIQYVFNNTYEYISQNGFPCHRDDVYNIFLALKSQGFIILTGDAGCGKKRFATSFANSLGANAANGRFKMISAEADWRASKELLGFLDSNSQFNEGVVLAFLKEAFENKDKPYFLCIDNFNIARPEQYMATFMSTLSNRFCDEDGNIVTEPILSREIFGKDDAAYEKWGDVRIGDNLYIFAIAKKGETFYPLTTEITDRAFSFEIINSSLVFNPPDTNQIEKALPIDADNSILKPELISADDFNSDFDNIKDLSFTLDLMNKTILSDSFPISKRTRDAILIYSYYSRKYDVFYPDKCLDFVITEKILPSIHGHTSNVQRCLSDLFVYSLLKGDNELEEYPATSLKMEQIKSFAKFKYPQTANKVIKMLRRYEDDGYTSFWK